MLKTSSVIFILFATVFLAGCSNKSTSSVQQKQQKSNQESTDSEDNPMQHYQNPELGFEFYYPENVLVTETSEVSFNIIKLDEIDGNSWEMKIFRNEEKREFKEWFDKTFAIDSNKDCMIMASNIKTKETDVIFISSDSMEDACLNGGYYVMSPSKLTVIELLPGQDVPSSFDDIVPTLRFTK